MTQVIKVQFSQGDSHMAANEANQKLYHREYDYFFVGEEVKAKKGQYAVVEANGVLKIVKVVGVGKFSGKANKYAIVVFDLESHEKRITQAKRIEELKETILARAEESRQRQRIRDLASEDEVLKGMLEELESLEKGA